MPRLTLALAEFMWAVMLLWPGDTFTRPTYVNMAKVMPEEFWGILFLISSFIQFTIVVANKMHSVPSWFFAGWNFMFWGYTVFSMLSSIYPPPAAIGGEIALAVIAFWIWFRPILLSEHDAC